MDPETAKLVAQISADATKTGAFLGFSGALIVAVVSAAAQLLLARRQLENQRTLANDEAGRRIRAARVDPFMAIAVRRVGAYLEWLNEAIESGDPEIVLPSVHQVDLWQDTSVLAVVYEPFKTALETFRRADREVDGLLTGTSGRKFASQRAWVTAVEESLDVLRTATAELQRRADEYVLQRVDVAV